MMKISTFLYTIRQGIVNIFRNKWYSLASIATISACLFLFGIFYCVNINFQSIVSKAQEGVSISVFFHDEKDGCPEEHLPGEIPNDQRLEEIGQLIKNRAEVSDVRFISDDEAWLNFAHDLFKDTFDRYSGGFPDNPLEGDNSYEVFISDVSLQSALITWLESIPEVREVHYSALTADTLSGVNLLIAYVSLGIIIILLAVSIFLISNTVAIGISVRATEINIMKYVGATDFFVRAPFVLEGMLIGLMGAAIPLLLIHALYSRALGYIAERFDILSRFLAFLPVDDIFKVLVPVSLVLGVGIGFMGSITTVKKHLHV